MSQELRNTLERWVTLAKKLKAWQIRLIEWRYEGWSYSEISKKLAEEYPEVAKNTSFNLNNLRKYLYHGGTLAFEFETYAEMMGLESIEEGQRTIKSAHKIAASTTVALLKSNNPGVVRLGAAREFMDRNVGKPTAEIKVTDSSKIDQLSEDIKKIIEGDRKPKKKKTNGKN